MNNRIRISEKKEKFLYIKYHYIIIIYLIIKSLIP